MLSNAFHTVGSNIICTAREKSWHYTQPFTHSKPPVDETFMFITRALSVRASI